ncbi:capsid protein [Equid alphaherpesvirus 1]|uniref:Capsid scaffolding protein n=2 Tax=Equid alphaherpesvirus 1 TaxID=10326 RepID=A0A0A7D9D6_9ALPH|nr:capsid protein [Equid alphaherpesvirus 1]
MDAYTVDGNAVSLPIYVAGYIALYDMGDGGELTLTRETVAAALPPASRLPINIDHRNGCVVGEVLSIVDDARGPFFLGIINCPQLGAVLATAAGPDFFGELSEGLSEQERLLYLVSNYLPSASLSSRRLGPDEEPDETLFAHVSLCVIGRRVGTIVTYDATPENAVAPFKRLSPSSREELLITAREAQSRLGDAATWHLSEDTLTRVLLSTAVNNMLLRNRWNLVARRRREAGIEGHTYLQASASFGITNGCNKADFCGAELVDTCGYKSGEKVHGAPYSRVTLGAKAFTSSSPNALPSSDNDKGGIGERTQKHISAMASSNPQTLSAAGAPLVSGDYILVPAAQYNQLVVGQHTSHPPINAGPATVTHAVPSQYIPPAYNSLMPPSMYQAPPYWSVPHSANLEAQITALVGALAADRKATKGSDPHVIQGSQCSPPLSPQQERRYARKRRHDWDATTRDDLEGIYYPGERSPRPGERRAGRPSTTIADLMGAVSSLQQEVSQLRAIQTVTAQPQAAPAGLYKPIPAVPPQYSQYQYIQPQHAVSAIVAPQLPGIPSQPTQAVLAPQVPAGEAPGSAKVVAASTAPQQAEQARAAPQQFEAVTSAAVLPVTQPQASSQTVDASASTGLEFGRDDADIFVSQMMSAR